MGKPVDLETLREIFKDPRQHIAVGVITKLETATDRSFLHVRVKILDPTLEVDREMVTVMSWDDCGPDCGHLRYPEISDLVLVAFVDGDTDQAYVVKRITSKEEHIPIQATLGHSVAISLAGKRYFVASDTGVHIGHPGNQGTEPLVLGNVLVNALTAFLNAFLNATQVGQSAMGPVMLDPTVRSALQSAMSQYLTTTSTNILSQIGFTER